MSGSLNQSPPDTPDSTMLSTALVLIDRALGFATSHGLRISAVVLDATFTPVALARVDGAFPSTVAVAIAKAHTALNFGGATHVLRERIVPENQRALSAVEPKLMFVGGGAPITREGRVVGALGISGGSEDQDIQCAIHACLEQPS